MYTHFARNIFLLLNNRAKVISILQGNLKVDDAVNKELHKSKNESLFIFLKLKLGTGTVSFI